MGPKRRSERAGASVKKAAVKKPTPDRSKNRTLSTELPRRQSERQKSTKVMHAIQNEMESDDELSSLSEEDYCPTPKKVRKKADAGGVGIADLLAMRDDEIRQKLEKGTHKKNQEVTEYIHMDEQPESLSGGTLKKYQLEGLQWLANNYSNGLNAVLADEMGLGKTVQTIALACHLKDYHGISGPHMVLAPKTTLGNWVKEFKKFAPSFKVIKFHGDKEARSIMAESIDEYDVIVTSYEMALRETETLENFKINCLIIDEAHRIKNDESKLAIACREIDCTHRLLLTGTPLQNNLKELWALLNFLFPKVFASSDDFENVFHLSGDSEEANREIVAKLHRILKPFMLRRNKAEVLVELPPKFEILLMVPLSMMQKRLYRELLSRNISSLYDSQSTQKGRLANLAMELRKCCNHPYLFEGKEDKTENPFGDHLIQNCGKLVFLDRLIHTLLPKGHKFLIFTQMVRLLDILDDYCRMKGLQYCRVDGQTSDREERIDKFQDDENIKIFLLSTRAGGLGINLTAADTVIIYDSDWNPQADLQAIDRAHRIGQHKPVTIYRFIHEHTIEEKIYDRANLKLQLDQAIIKRRAGKDSSKGPTKEGLLKAVTYGASQIFSTGSDLEHLSKEAIDKIFKSGRLRQEEVTQKWRDQMNRSLMNFEGFDDTTKSDQLANMFVDNIQLEEEARDREAWIGGAQQETTDDPTEKVTKRRGRLDSVRNKRLEEIRADVFGHTAPVVANQNQPWHFLDTFALNDIDLQIQQAIEDARFRVETLSEVEYAEQLTNLKNRRDELFEKCFCYWSKSDFHLFLRSAEAFGLKRVSLIANDFIGIKPPEEVHRFAEAFQERILELPDWKRIMTRIQKGEDEHSKRAEIASAIQAMVTRPGWELPRGAGYKFRVYDEANDRFLLNFIGRVGGYGEWDRLKVHLKSTPNTKYDWYAMTRPTNDWRIRADGLARGISKGREKRKAGIIEEEEDEEDDV